MWREVCTPVFTQRYCQQSRHGSHLSVGQWMMLYTYHGLLSQESEGNPTICNCMDGLGGHYTKWNKSDRERQVLYSNESKNTKFLKTESRMVVTRGWSMGAGSELRR